MDINEEFGSFRAQKRAEAREEVGQNGVFEGGFLHQVAKFRTCCCKGNEVWIGNEGEGAVEDAGDVENVLERGEVERGRRFPSPGEGTSGGSVAGVGVGAAAEGRNGRPRIGSHDKGGSQQGAGEGNGEDGRRRRML